MAAMKIHDIYNLKLEINGYQNQIFKKLFANEIMEMV